MMRSAILTGVLAGLTGVAPGQTVHVGPLVAPAGCDILASVANDSDQTVLLGSIGPIRVRDASGSEVFFDWILFFQPEPLPPGDVREYFRWDQTDKNGLPVPAGIYTMEVTVNTRTTTWNLVLGGVDAAVASVGVHRPGTTRSLYLCSPGDPGGLYVLAASFATGPGIPTCGGTVPLNPDLLFGFSVAPGNGVFLNTIGSLDPPAGPHPGSTTRPAIAVPNLPLQGFQFVVAFVVVDFSVACPVVRVSEPLTITIQ